MNRSKMLFFVGLLVAVINCDKPVNVCQAQLISLIPKLDRWSCPGKCSFNMQDFTESQQALDWLDTCKCSNLLNSDSLEIYKERIPAIREVFLKMIAESLVVSFKDGNIGKASGYKQILVAVGEYGKIPDNFRSKFEKKEKEFLYPKITYKYYRELLLNPLPHQGYGMTVVGGILQKGDDFLLLHCYLGGHLVNVHVCGTVKALGGDVVEISGAFKGTHTYTSVRGDDLTLPSMSVESFKFISEAPSWLNL